MGELFLQLSCFDCYNFFFLVDSLTACEAAYLYERSSYCFKIASLRLSDSGSVIYSFIISPDISSPEQIEIITDSEESAGHASKIEEQLLK